MGQRKKRDRQAYLEAGADLLCKKAYQLCKESCAPKTAADGPKRQADAVYARPSAFASPSPPSPPFSVRQPQELQTLY